MLKKIALLVALAYGSVLAQNVANTTEPASLVPGVIYNTGNIVQQTTTSTGSTWTGAVYQDQLTCWYGGDPGYCGPNAIVRPGNLLNFSYGSTYVYQQQHISTLLPSSTGLQVNGYNFGFNAKNGNGWDDGRTDQLTALVRFWDNTGNKGANNLLYGTSYNLNYQFNWTNFNYNETFTKPLAVPDVGLVQYGFIGKDNNFWQGPYGPELYNISFSLKYSVDPCIKDPLYSPTCPGYMEALNKLLPSATIATVADPVAATSIAAAPTVVTEPIQPTTTTSTPSTTGQVSAVAAVVSAPAPSTSTTTSSSSSTTASSSSSTQTKETTSSSSNTSLALSLISKNQDKEKEIAMSASQNAIQAAEQAGAQAQQEAVSVASQAVANSVTAGSAAVRTDGSSSSGRGGTSTSVTISIDTMVQSNQSNQSMGLGPAQVTSSSSQQQEQVAILAPVVTTSQVTSIVQMTNPTVTNNNESNKTTTFETPLLAPTPTPVSQKSQPVIQTASIPQPVVPVQTTQEQQSSATTQSIYTLLPPQQSTNQPYVAPIVSYELFTSEPIQQTQIQSTQTTTETVSVLPPNLLTDKSNPLTDIIDNKQNIPQNSTISTIGSSVNRNTSDNEVAGGVDINKMALAPAGYSDYLSLTLRDAAFYEPKEVYKNQRNVDNARLLRLLTNDNKHKEMVEQQYKGN